MWIWTFHHAATYPIRFGFVKGVGVIAEAQVTAAQYDAIFQRERRVQYPVVDAFEECMGYAVDRERLENAARVLACPYKKAPPNWQHGRVLYAVARNVLEFQNDAFLLDVGTAKGFSALCLQWACSDSFNNGHVWSCDVVDPAARVMRNTVAEVEGPKTLDEVLAPWPESKAISFKHAPGGAIIKRISARWHLAYVDGKHTYEAVSYESKLLSERQESGDVIVFDDLQIPGVDRAVKELKGYDVERLWVLRARGYAIARKV